MDFYNNESSWDAQLHYITLTKLWFSWTTQNKISVQVVEVFWCNWLDAEVVSRSSGENMKHNKLYLHEWKQEKDIFMRLLPPWDEIKTLELYNIKRNMNNSINYVGYIEEQLTTTTIIVWCISMFNLHLLKPKMQTKMRERERERERFKERCYYWTTNLRPKDGC